MRAYLTFKGCQHSYKVQDETSPQLHLLEGFSVKRDILELVPGIDKWKFKAGIWLQKFLSQIFRYCWKKNENEYIKKKKKSKKVT